MAPKIKLPIKVNRELLKTYATMVMVCIALELLFLFVAQIFVEKQVKNSNREKAEIVATKIQTELFQGFETTELLKGLYKVYGYIILDDFDKICTELKKSNFAIGSMYFAPKGIIKYAFPSEVNSTTINFDMLNDSIQGPKAQKALNDKLATIAGPHKLIEGGEGFIIRNPIFSRNEFIGFSIVVLDKERVIKQIFKQIPLEEYDVAVWKEPDKTAITDINGFIINTAPESSPIPLDVQTSFRILNDSWHVAIHPKKGWKIASAMKKPVLISIGIFLLLCFLLYMHVLGIDRKRQLQMQIYANKAKSRFLFSMSHDIRTPMNAIIGFTNLMKKNLDDREKIEYYLDKVELSSNFLLSLINNVLEMARIESGKESLNENIIDTQKFEDTTDAVFSDLAREKNISFSNEYNLIHDYVIGDEVKIREITLNIVSNAIKYTPAGGSVKLYLQESACDKVGYTLFTAIAEDSGIGISDKFLPHIFEEFSREKNSTESKVSGSGLGMPIVKKLLDIMDGTIEIKSKQGKGTKVIVKIPLKLPSQKQIEAAQKNKKKITADDSITQKTFIGKHNFMGKKVLLAEDNELNAEIAIAILKELGFIVTHVNDGAECVKCITDNEADFYDLVLMDIQMPNMNGYDATIAIRNLNDKNKAQIPIVAMTANAFDEDRKKAFQVGINGYVAKPIHLPTLINALDAVFSKKNA